MKKNSIFKQAAFLAAAGILVRIIGLLYRSPLTKLIGSQGMGYYSTAYNVYALILLVSSYSIPTAISKLLSEKLAVNQYNNVKKILLCSFIYIVAVGGGAAIIAFVIAPYIVPDKAVSALRILCPTIFLSGLLGIFRGYFQAFKTTAFTGISQIIEQVFNAGVSIGAAYLFIQPYLNNQSLVASHGATGSALGTGAGVLISLCYMLFMFKRTKQSYLNPPNIEAADPHTDSFKDIFKMISNIVTPIILATCVYNLISTIDMYMFYLVCGDGAKSISAFGAYGGEYIILQNVPVALASAMSTASIPNIHHDDPYSQCRWNEYSCSSDYSSNFSAKRNGCSSQHPFNIWESSNCFLWSFYLYQWIIASFRIFIYSFKKCYICVNYPLFYYSISFTCNEFKYLFSIDR